MTSECDAPFVLVYLRQAHREARSHLTVENSLWDLPGAYDMPKLVIREPASLSHLKTPWKHYSATDPAVVEQEGEYYSSLNILPVSPVVAVEIWSTVVAPDPEDAVQHPPCASDTGLWIRLGEGRSLVLAVNDSIMCHVQLATQPDSQQALLAGMSLRRTLTAASAHRAGL